MPPSTSYYPITPLTLSQPYIRARRTGAAQLKALRHSALGGQAHATLIKGAEGAKWLITRPGFTRELLASSAAVVQDETGMRPSAFRAESKSGGLNADHASTWQATAGRAWVVRTFGNQSAAAFAYICFGISSDGTMVKDWWRFNVSTEEAMAMQAELEATFQGGSRDLPFSFGYGGLSGSGSGNSCRGRYFTEDRGLPTGLMLSAWRAELS